MHCPLYLEASGTGEGWGWGVDSNHEFPSLVAEAEAGEWLSEQLYSFCLGFPTKGRGLQLSQECVPELSGLVSGLGAPQGKKGVPQLQAV